MGEIKPWQMIVIAVAVIVLGFSAWRFMSGARITQPDGIMTIDIVTGQLYDVKKGKARGIVLPARHPDTNERTLYPVEFDESKGEWVLIERYAVSLDADKRSASEYVGSGINVTVSNDNPIKHVIMP